MCFFVVFLESILYKNYFLKMKYGYIEYNII